MEGPSLTAANPTLSHVHQVWNEQRKNSPIYRLLIGNIDIYKAEEGTIYARLLVEENHTNSKGTLHGTLTACIVDWAAGMAIASHGSNYTGVSTDISISYLSTAKQGDMLEVKSRALKVGGTLAFHSIEIWTEKDGKKNMVATGSHTKFVRRRETRPDENK